MTGGRPLIPLTVACFALAGAVLFLPPRLRAWAWLALGLGYLGLSTWATVSMGSGLLGPVWTHGDPAGEQVALTYDDGPDPASTAALLDLFAAEGVQATFFCVGERARAHPELVRRARAEGHLLANHSQHHGYLTNFLFGPAMRRELAACQATLVELTGERPHYYRPPLGLMNHATLPAARALGLELVGWRVRSLDTTGRSVEQVLARVRRRLRGGDIVLLHDGGQEPERVVALARGILATLRERGLTAVRLDALIAPDGEA